MLKTLLNYVAVCVRTSKISPEFDIAQVGHLTKTWPYIRSSLCAGWKSNWQWLDVRVELHVRPQLIFPTYSSFIIFCTLFRVSKPQLGRPAYAGAQLQTLSLASNDLYFNLKSNPNQNQLNFKPHFSINFSEEQKTS